MGKPGFTAGVLVLGSLLLLSGCRTSSGASAVKDDPPGSGATVPIGATSLVVHFTASRETCKKHGTKVVGGDTYAVYQSCAIPGQGAQGESYLVPPAMVTSPQDGSFFYVSSNQVDPSSDSIDCAVAATPGPLGLK